MIRVRITAGNFWRAAPLRVLLAIVVFVVAVAAGAGIQSFQHRGVEGFMHTAIVCHAMKVAKTKGLNDAGLRKLEEAVAASPAADARVKATMQRLKEQPIKC